MLVDGHVDVIAHIPDFIDDDDDDDGGTAMTVMHFFDVDDAVFDDDANGDADVWLTTLMVMMTIMLMTMFMKDEADDDVDNDVGDVSDDDGGASGDAHDLDDDVECRLLSWSCCVQTRLEA